MGPETPCEGSAETPSNHYFMSRLIKALSRMSPNKAGKLMFGRQH
jgi:hypothetical protein